MVKELSEQSKKILSCIADSNSRGYGLTSGFISAKLGIPYRSVRGSVRQMVGKNLIRGFGKNTDNKEYYVVKQETQI